MHPSRHTLSAGSTTGEPKRHGRLSLSPGCVFARSRSPCRTRRAEPEASSRAVHASTSPTELKHMPATPADPRARSTPDGLPTWLPTVPSESAGTCWCRTCDCWCLPLVLTAWLIFVPNAIDPRGCCCQLAFAVLMIAHARILNANDRTQRAQRYFERGLARLDGRGRARDPMARGSSRGIHAADPICSAPACSSSCLIPQRPRLAKTRSRTGFAVRPVPMSSSRGSRPSPNFARSRRFVSGWL